MEDLLNPQRRKLLILDKDGTLVEPISDPSGFVQSPDDQVLLPGVLEALRLWCADGWTPVIVSNQGGVAAGHKSLEQAISEMRAALDLTGIQVGFLCPDFEGQDCWMLEADGSATNLNADGCGRYAGRYRKPNCGMLKTAIDMAGWQSGSSVTALMVGDRPEDMGAAQAAGGIPFMWAASWRAQKFCGFA